jgi:hypothetical protein
LRDQGVQTDREVLAKRSDMIIKYKEERICLLIDVVLPSDRNIIEKEAEKKLKCKNLSSEIQQNSMKCFAISVIIGATGIVSKSWKQYQESIQYILYKHAMQLM